MLHLLMWLHRAVQPMKLRVLQGPTKLCQHYVGFCRVTCLSLQCELCACCACCADEIRESDIGTGAGLFEVRKIGDEFFTFIVDCKASCCRD